MKICPFCKHNFTLVVDGFILVCNNHKPIFVYFFGKSTFLCENEFEIEIDSNNNQTILNKHTQLTKYEANYQKTRILYNNYYYYGNHANTILTLNNTYNITPDNFHLYLSKFKSLIPFS